MTKEGESHMPEKENPFDKNKDADRDLFTDESDIFGEELKKSRAGDRKKLYHEEQEEDSLLEDEVNLSYEEEKPASQVRRILIIAASIVVGIGLGVGGYFFFTAGNKHAPVEKQIAKTIPEPAPVPVVPVIPSEKPNAIPEIPVKAEPQKPEIAQAKEAKPQEFLSKAEAKKEAPVAIKGKRAYYVQTGLFENEANAKAMADKLRQKGYAPSVKNIEGKDKKVMFRVTAGTYANFKKAVEVSETLSKQGVKAIVRKQ
jgi:cell division septation protein DedD